ncbi:MAG TPA: hypothetical protein VJL29_12075 [Thermoguttaceae bacterium]|nr:hypothetical protein [Thermoguttaceae bacterium]
MSVCRYGAFFLVLPWSGGFRLCRTTLASAPALRLHRLITILAAEEAIGWRELADQVCPPNDLPDLASHRPEASGTAPQSPNNYPLEASPSEEFRESQPARIRRRR